MGEVYKGSDSHGKPVILKLSRPNVAVYEQQLENEIRVCHETRHPNIVKTSAAGKLVLDGTDYYYMLQEFCEGGNLKSRIRPGIPLETCMDWFRQMIAGVRALHVKFVHRDLKPENILIDSEGNLRIADFGLAKVLGDTNNATDPFNGWGTVEYMAPECWTFAETTPATDIYSLGIMFFEILTGELPCKSHKARDLKEFHLHQPLPRLANCANVVSGNGQSECDSATLAELQEILDVMTAKNPEDRRLPKF